MTLLTNGSDQDRGEGPSSLHPTLQACVRIRPISIRFTEPGVLDLHLPLHSVTSLRAVSSPSTLSRQETIFDLDVEANSPSAGVVQDRERLAEEVMSKLEREGLMGDETVRRVKQQMEGLREGVRGRRVRMIHAGRILKDAVRLVGYLDEVQRRRVGALTLRELALDEGGEKVESEDVEEEEEDGERTERKEMSMRELLDWLLSLSRSDDEQGTQESTGKGKSREPSYYADTVRVTIRTAPTVYIQCSVGDPLSTHPDIDPPPLIDTSPLDDSNTSNHQRGFNRLLEAGLSPTEIASIRTQFRITQPLPNYDPILAPEHDAHLLEMEDSWMDSFHSPTHSDPTDPTGSAYMSLMQGLMVGFFLPPLIPIFWFRDKAHPSSITDTQPTEDGDEMDDEQEWQTERAQQGAESVFSGPMQISILFGLMANVIMGLFRVVW